MPLVVFSYAQGLLVGKVVFSPSEKPGGNFTPPPPADVDVGGTVIRARVTRKSRDDLGLGPGRAVYALVKAVAIDRPSRP